ncbi:unnamed protein product, partial [Allacma fusca]
SIEISEQNFTDESDIFEIHTIVNTTGRNPPAIVLNDEPTSSLTTSSLRSVGQFNHKPYSSAVWIHFKKNKATGKSLCNHCKNEYYTNATNLKRHLKFCKPDFYQQVQKKDDTVQFKNLAQTTTVSKKNWPFWQQEQPFLARFYNQEFKDCIKVADKKLRIPCRNTIASDVKTLQREFLESISAALKPVRRMTICSDIWTKKGQTSSYLWVMVVFYHPTLQKKMQLLLGVQKFETVKHTSADIIREMRAVIDKFDIQPRQIWRAMTDGGANMISSHRMDASIFAKFRRQEKKFHLVGPLGNDEDAESDEEMDAPQNTNEHPNIPSLIENGTEDENLDMSSTYRSLTCFIHNMLRCICIGENEWEL